MVFTSLFYPHTQGILGDQDTSSDVFQTSCNLLDRFLSKKAVSGEHELVACAGACMMIACKIRNGPYNQHHHLTACIPCSMNLLVVSNKHSPYNCLRGGISWVMNICQFVPLKGHSICCDEQTCFSVPQSVFVLIKCPSFNVCSGVDV